MAKKKIVEEYIYEGLGFPILLRNIPLIEIRGVWTPDVNLLSLQKAVLLGLAYLPSELSGNQIRFIRTWLNLTQTTFAQFLGVTHPAVVKWEKSGDDIAKLTLTTQRDLRLLILDHLLARDKEFRHAFRQIHEKKFSKTHHLLSLDVPTDLIAI